MKCKNCGHEFTCEFCPECGWGPDCELESTTREIETKSSKNSFAKQENTVSKVCKLIAGIYIAVMVLGSMIFGAHTADAMYSGAIGWGIFLGGSLVGLSTGMILFGIGEIIRLLDKQQK